MLWQVCDKEPSPVTAHFYKIKHIISKLIQTKEENIFKGWMYFMNTKELAQERTQIFTDVLEGKIPKRVPVYAMLTYEFAIQYAGMDMMEAQWHTEQYFEKVADIICQDFYSDSFGVTNLRFPAMYRTLGARNWLMGSSGFMQHPEVVGLEADEYDDFIASPYDCIIEKVLPRLYTNLNTDPHQKAITMAKAFKIFFEEMGRVAEIAAKMTEKYGYGQANFFAGACEAPLDFVADQLRGFRNISADIRRMPDKVKAAAEAVTPVMIKMGIPAPLPNSAVFIPLHMAPFMRTKDAEELYFPTFKKVVDELAALGHRCFLFVEENFMRYLDLLYEFPEGTIMMFEYGDPKLTKEKIGDKHIIAGFYPVTMLKTATKQECIDKAKELIDTLAPGGRYIFTLDKSPVSVGDINPDNLKAVYEYVGKHANY